MIIAIIMSALALCVAAASFVSAWQCKDKIGALYFRQDEENRNLSQWKNLHSNMYNAEMELFRNTFDGIEQRVKALEEGTCPDYEKAKAAAEAVNSFNDGLSNILGYDPFAAAKKQRQDEQVMSE